ncbi:MAG: hypothetical protein DI533_09730 [Cereibacter sphaeroides]|uniref:Uncharacterized protein n=1 Tax=Cereibacter sphaeroides TaxID=1063 RepID=A0A2W5SN60_CERSP|nr:MAG: hypothetical protein DI533_09730 [Cereibacter sphaeroides]
MLSRPLIPLLLLMAACGTPQERCINGVTRELRVINDLIQETELNLARGYRYDEITITRTFWVPCNPPIVVTQPNGSQQLIQPGGMCMDDEDEVIRRREAIDPISEQNKLNGLKKRQMALAKAAEPAIAQCRLLNPQ